MNWIKVSEGLPKKYELVIVWIPYVKRWAEAWLSREDGKWHTSTSTIDYSSVTHWAYIEPPKE
jgi:hypothetical protein